MRKYLLGLVILSILFVVACAPEVSKEKLQAGLDTLSDHDLDAVINETSKENAPALAGQAVLSKLIPPTIKVGVSNSRLLVSAQALKIKRLEEKVAMLEKGIPPTIQPPDPNKQPPDPMKESSTSS